MALHTVFQNEIEVRFLSEPYVHHLQLKDFILVTICDLTLENGSKSRMYAHIYVVPCISKCIKILPYNNYMFMTFHNYVLLRIPLSYYYEECWKQCFSCYSVIKTHSSELHGQVK